GGSITQPIGTGPFRYVEWLPDQYLKVERFAYYVADTRPASGFVGRHEALVDEIYFRPIPEASVRAAALENGEVQVAQALAYPDYVRLQGHPLAVVEIVPSATIADIRFGFKQGPFRSEERRV